MDKEEQLKFDFPRLKKRRIEARFKGGEVSSDGGALLLRQVDRKLGLTRRLAEVLPEERDLARCDHDQLTMLRQRIYGLCLGYEDLNDHDRLRHDVGLQTSVDRQVALASSPTLSRWENRADRKTLWLVHQILMEQFVGSFSEVPKELILDFDATDDRVHGKQEGRFFHGYYGDYCFLPLYVFCGEQLLVSYLRPSNIDPALHAWAILKLLVGRLRKLWPGVKIIMRADSGFCRWRMLRWCEAHGVEYIIGVAQNNRLNTLAQGELQRARQQYESTGEKQRRFSQVLYQAKTWDRARKVIVKAEHTDKGSNPRYVVTNLKAEPKDLYDHVYCMRGEMENRIKEQQLGLFADRTSCRRWWANQLRLLLSSCAYVLMETLRRIGLKATDLAKAQVSTIRLKLLKIGTVIIKNSRCIRFLLSSAYPYQKLFAQVAAAFSSA